MKKTAEQIVARSTNVIVTTIMAMVSRFLELKTTTFIQIWQTTTKISRMRKTGNRFFDKVKKMNCLNCVTNYNYENMVNHARSKQAMGDLKMAMISAGVPDDKIDSFFDTAKKDITDNAETFQSEGLPWGDYVDDSKCIIRFAPDEKGKSPYAGIDGYYIQCCILNYATPVYRWIDTDVELTDAELTEMKGFITPKKDEGKRQGLKNPKVIRSPRFETIDSISMNKANYQLTN
ncbi:MAG: hypothetical protein ACXQT0_04760 [Candidatus Methanofastidiosia archaeon]